MKPIVRLLRLHCAMPTANPIPGRDGVLAVAAGVSVVSAAGVFVNAAHRRLIGGFGVPLPDTMCVELDCSGCFDLLVDVGDDTGLRRSALTVGDRPVPARSREAFLCWAGDVGRHMLRRVDAVREGEWAGAEG